ncbi:hypothetical protein [Luteibaculum oceani]|uniref:SRPBCC family protein n=1 Tax=Luteibaculum oceani TaxID=1294296 RepID=A0A5C6VPM5_9FLAO|nr:hypothetical protein [Luteibaculum oceani]TXC85218.1 hypothetical protein FRX97_00930 [Luteibaculum oceani]
MKLSFTEIIEAPKELVAELMRNEHNKDWQDGFVGASNIEGNPGEEGCKTRLQYELDGNQFEIIETIWEIKNSSLFHVGYEFGNINNYTENYFESLSENQTKWISNTYFKFPWIMYLMSFRLKRKLRDHSFRNIRNFKRFVESKAH